MRLPNPTASNILLSQLPLTPREFRQVTCPLASYPARRLAPPSDLVTYRSAAWHRAGQREHAAPRSVCMFVLHRAQFVIGTADRPRPNGGSIILYVKGRTFIVGQRVLRLMSNLFVLVMCRRSLPQYLEEKQ
jgi:hypothetical protein